MQITLTASAAHLHTQIGWVAALLPTRPAIPVLAGMLLEVTGDKAVVTGTDYEVWSQACLDADLEGEGRVVLPGRLLANLLSRLPRTQMVTLDITHAQVRVTCQATHATLMTLPIEDYPTLPEWPAEVGRMEAGDLSRAVGRVAPAVSTDPTLPMLTGIHVHATEAGLVLTGTDRYSLGQDVVAWEPALETEALPDLLVPGAALTQAAKALSGTITVGITHEGADGMVLGLADATRRLSLRLLESDYVKVEAYRKAAHKQATITVTVDTEPLRAAIDRISVFAAGEIPIVLTLAGDHLVVRGGTDAEAAEERVDALVMDTGHTADGLRIHFQVRRLLAGLTSLRSEAVRLALGDPHKPVVLTCADDDPAWWLTMPVHQ
ncbi:DNA polymerase III subunit beta [Nocardiopsis dassonvillei]|uniref:DNA polymerase III subunit beta n=1 Tax=Nocardiopsis dassonvillei TaxID=2014 RepID=UPI003F543A66